MTDHHHVFQPHRCIISVSGSDAMAFLQGLITNDMELVSRGRAIYAALLTPQGKYLHDFFVIGAKDGFYVDCETDRRQDLISRLTRYRLRARVDIGDTETPFDVFALTGTEVSARLGLPDKPGAATEFAGGLAYTDPRSNLLGVRACLPAGTGVRVLEEAGFSKGDPSDYEALRFSLGIADGAPEIEPERSYPMEYGLDRLNGVSFSKGCYVGQEVTVRMKNRDLARKCLSPVKIQGAAPTIGTHLYLDDANAGELRGITGEIGLALIRKDLLDRALSEDKPLKADGARFFPTKP